jgi:hypothetical protein
MLALLVIQVQQTNFSMTFDSLLAPGTLHYFWLIPSVALSNLQQRPHSTLSTQFTAEFCLLPAHSHFSQGSLSMVSQGLVFLE